MLLIAEHERCDGATEAEEGCRLVAAEGGNRHGWR